MASSSSSTLFSSNSEEDLTSENAEPSASNRDQVQLTISNLKQVMNKRIVIKQEVQDVASSTNVNVQSNIDVINDSSCPNLLPPSTVSHFEQSSDNDYQMSVSVDDETSEKTKLKSNIFYLLGYLDALINQGHLTVNKVVEQTAGENPSGSNPIDQAVLSTINRNISENNETTASSGVEPHKAPTTRIPTT
ncbi:unnamed protein product [Rotaria sp. Silwood2]|nr:unnamed protein product [Rotaria sp. Silwood2]CAF4190811.1 unnamed protein product [Rotaria sp. Silwood2]